MDRLNRSMKKDLHCKADLGTISLIKRGVITAARIRPWRKNYSIVDTPQRRTLEILFILHKSENVYNFGEESTLVKNHYISE